MRKMAGMLALGLLLAFGTVTLSYAADPAPAPTDDKDKKPSGPKVFASDEKKDEKKDDKGGK